ncbi:MAG: hypothetical protein A2Y14_04150 [Verrucomicrobia bacterium GWF2_51_19]|nr:MAG: hypothetical protein A2Y14_04150 [Verrucomicrobia bacterium GWF2_51_19]HCJ11801.1 hypothetical protein [Opitutae bacterium]
MEGNALILQSGQPTAVANASLSGLINEALNQGNIENIYGSIDGFRGLLTESLIDLAEESQQMIRALEWTPGAVLGTGGSFILDKQTDLDRACEVISRHNIRYVFCIGDSSALTSASNLLSRAQSKSYELFLIAIPQSAQNNFSSTDYTLGYGSALKTFATALREMELETIKTSDENIVNLVEVQGQNNSWLTAGSILSKAKKESSYLLIYTLEQPLQISSFLNNIREALKATPTCTVVFPSNITDENGNYFSNEQGSLTPAEHLAAALEDNLGLKTQIRKFSSELRTQSSTISAQDSKMATIAAQVAVKSAIEKGQTGQAITFFRNDRDAYSCEIQTVDIATFMASQKNFPTDWIDSETSSIKYPFVKYASPLIQGEIQVQFEQGLPKFAQFQKLYVTKQLPAHSHS